MIRRLDRPDRTVTNLLWTVARGMRKSGEDAADAVHAQQNAHPGIGAVLNP